MAVCLRCETLMADGHQAGVACRSVCVREAVRVESAYVSRPHVRARERAREGMARLHVYVLRGREGGGEGKSGVFGFSVSPPRCSKGDPAV